MSLNNFHTGPINIQSLAECIRELALDENINDFSDFKNIIDRSNKQAISILFVAASRKGIIRDVEYMIPLVVANEVPNVMEDALVAAAENCHIRIVKMLLRNGANIEYKKNLPLRKAVEKGHTESVICLVEFGANVHIDNDELILHCCRSGDYPDVLKILVSYGLNLLSNYSIAYETCLLFDHQKSIEYLVKYSSKNLQQQPTTSNPFKDDLFDDESLIDFSEEINDSYIQLEDFDSEDIFE